MTIETAAEAKTLAKGLRQALAEQGTPISHGEALERIAHQAGARDWNTLHARLSAAGVGMLRLRDPVQGRYLGQKFTGRVVALSVFEKVDSPGVWVVIHRVSESQVRDERRCPEASAAPVRAT